MAASAMASVASSFVLTSTPHARGSASSICKAKANAAAAAAPGSRFVRVRAAEASVAPAAGEDGKVTATPPKIGPKRGTKVKIIRQESYWYNAIGSVVTVDQDPATRYPVVVRFNRINYANISTNNYALDEIMEVN